LAAMSRVRSSNKKRGLAAACEEGRRAGSHMQRGTAAKRRGAKQPSAGRATAAPERGGGPATVKGVEAAMGREGKAATCGWGSSNKGGAGSHV